MRVAAVLAASAVALGLIPGAARPAGSAQVTISMVSIFTQQPAFDVLIPNFERVYPNITVTITYAPTALA